MWTLWSFSGHVQKHIGKLLFDNVSELKSTQFREGWKSYKGIRGVAGFDKEVHKKIRVIMVVQSKVMLVTPVNGECSNGNMEAPK